jgi:hypothetical protein
MQMNFKKKNILYLRKLQIVIIFLLIIFVSLAIAATPPPQKSSPTSGDKDTTIAGQEKLNMTINILFPLVSAVLGGLSGAGISIYYSRRQAKQEYRSLILSFCSEMVSIFWRCVKYYKQSKTGEISYSALFSFTDSSTLSKFASVCKKPEVVAAIVELKSMYFQIQRHVEEASRFAVEGSRTSAPNEKDDLMKKAARAQRTALAFFHSSYENIEKEMDLIVQTAKQVAPGSVADNLYSKFIEAKTEKKNLENSITTAST